VQAAGVFLPRNMDSKVFEMQSHALSVRFASTQGTAFGDLFRGEGAGVGEGPSSGSGAVSQAQTIPPILSAGGEWAAGVHAGMERGKEVEEQVSQPPPPPTTHLKLTWKRGCSRIAAAAPQRAYLKPSCGESTPCYKLKGLRPFREITNLLRNMKIIFCGI
jgi:hypothetical protein